jgi:DNA (cytosine-5)-methyltransferase 1
VADGRGPHLDKAAVMRPRLLDLFCGAGGAAMGYARAGFDVTGVDIRPQPHYPFTFIRADALQFVELDDFDLIHASPPCQRWTSAGEMWRQAGRQYPDLIAATWVRLQSCGIAYVLENVPGSPLLDPVTLCGAMFPELRVIRHRLFETSFRLTAPEHRRHPRNAVGVYGHPGKKTGMAVAGSVADWRAAMGDVDWMTGDELAQSVPPAYTAYVGRAAAAIDGRSA